MKTIECAYCFREVEDSTVPDIWDADGWEEEARHHAPVCEWVRTKAHRLDEHPATRLHCDLVREDGP